MQYTPLEDDSLALKAENGEDKSNNSKANDSSFSIKNAGSKTPRSSDGALQRELSEPLTGSIGDNGESDYRGNGHTDSSNREAEHKSEDDPFYVFKDDLLRKLGLMEETLSNYLSVVHNTDTAVNTHEVKDVKKQIKRHIKHAESTLKDLQTINRLVEKQREKFPNINDNELEERVTFVKNSLSQISQVKQAMNSNNVKDKIAADERALAVRRTGATNMNGQSELEKENSAFLVDNSTQAQLMMRQQDETLDDLDDAVVRVGTMADNIHLEIESQNKLLGHLDDDLQDAEEKLGMVMGKLGKMLKTKNKCQLGTILTLIVVVVVLFFLVLYS